MQACTHFLAGAAIQQALWAALPPSATRVVALGVLGVASHLILDDVARMTYHPPSLDWTRKGFTIVYHLLVVVAGGWVFLRWQAWWPGMLAALIPDLDWIVLRPLTWVGIGPTCWRDGVSHRVFRKLPFLGHANRLACARFPDWRFTPAAALLELALVACLVLLVPL